MTGPGDLAGNYLALMEQRGWTWDDLADQFDRDAAEGRALDGGANARRMAAWARSMGDAGRARQRTAATEQRDPIPEQPTPDPRKRTAAPRDPARRTASGATAVSEVLDSLDSTPSGS